MKEFLTLISPENALDKIISGIVPYLTTEEILTAESLGRISGRNYCAPHPLPNFRRSTVDGYALIASDTFGTTDTIPALIKITGEVLMGVASDISITSGHCAKIHTGGMLPEGADSVVMIENTQQTDVYDIEVYKSVATGENVINIGEDIEIDREIIKNGVRIRPVEIGGLLALGYTQIVVYTEPKVGIISSGDELINPKDPLEIGKVRDINAYTIGGLVIQSGAKAKLYGIVKDNETELLQLAQKALVESDILVITAGSSASTRDLTSLVIEQLGEPGVLVHGVNIKPGKPTILGICEKKPIIGLPGNPVSAFVIAQLFLVPIIEHISGLREIRYRPRIAARLTTNLASQAGREDWIAVNLQEKDGQYIAEPVFGKSNLIFMLINSTGLIRIPVDVTGLEAGTQVDVFFI